MKIKSVSYRRKKSPSKNFKDCSKTIVTAKATARGRTSKVKEMIKQLGINQVQRSSCASSLRNSLVYVCYTPINYLHRKLTVELSQRLESDSTDQTLQLGFCYGF